ncbi:uncharacterized protein [Canis lupus baileyi]|uniref:nascent polypeptide-associated complex subunit alpha, muscle-specific form-like n=1 Tax=Canis lupus dingo TaxID=286419 RepID=UPI000DC671AF|nr:nascent polypeptide-associated complex subunit alpha, muscle-specific form-like [Canis lupus dingo]XP_035561501.1 nascent polypeptide-associated complex subunit alpha, muscle-specific form-like [Canis lupus dingo]
MRGTGRTRLHLRAGPGPGQVRAAAAFLPRPRSGLCGTRAREAPQPRGGWHVPPPPSAAAVTPTQVCCRHFFFCPQEPAPPAGALASDLCGLLLPPFSRGAPPSPPAPQSLSCLRPGPCGATTGVPSALQGPSLGLQLGRQAFLLQPGQGLWSPHVFPRQGSEDQHKKDHLGFRVWPPHPHPLLQLQGKKLASPAPSQPRPILSLRCTLQAQEARGPHFPNPTQVRVTAEARRVLLPPAPGEPGSAKVAPASPSLTIVRESGPHSTDLELGGPSSFLLQRHFSSGGDPGSLQDSTEGPAGTAPGLGSLLGVEGV